MAKRFQIDPYHSVTEEQTCEGCGEALMVAKTRGSCAFEVTDTQAQAVYLVCSGDCGITIVRRIREEGS